MRLLTLCLFFIVTIHPALAQWRLQKSNTTADLRGIHNVGAGAAWASGTAGTVLRTTDEGRHWLTCAIPPGADKLDFRGVQALDANTAIVMSSGKGELSRLYKTTDACRTWRLVFLNPDKQGFWNALQFAQNTHDKKERCFGAIVGDAVRNSFPMFLTFDCGEKWERQTKQFPVALQGEELFAASNTSLLVDQTTRRSFITGGVLGSRIFQYLVESSDTPGPEDYEANVAPGRQVVIFKARHMQVDKLPWKHPSKSAGAFSIADRPFDPKDYGRFVVIVGGNYAMPNDPGFAATGFLGASGSDWHSAVNPPHGYRSAVAYDSLANLWITVGPNGTDISVDDGRTWCPLRPSAALNERPDADRNWNAISLPYVVGANGRIGRLRRSPITP